MSIISNENFFDVIVLGVGSMGSSACYYLAKQGLRVLGLEQFDIPNELSSHAGQSRLIRKAYYEQPDYVPLLERAYENWKHLENITDSQIYHETGLLYFGKPSHPVMQGIHQSANEYHIRLETIHEKDLSERYPQINIPRSYESLLEPEAGFLTPGKAIGLYVAKATEYGAVFKTNIKIISWKKTADGITVQTDSGNFFAKKLVITAGPWAGKLLPAFSSSLTITRQMLAWVKLKKKAAFELGKLPCWIIAPDDKHGIYYGFPILPPDRFEGPTGFKLAHHYPGQITDPDTIDRLPTHDDEAVLIKALNKYFLGCYESTVTMKACMYTNSPDENFIIDFLPGYETEVIVATGFSGHGFKFASVVGEILCDLAMRGYSDLPIGFLNAKRFLTSSSL